MKTIFSKNTSSILKFLVIAIGIFFVNQANSQVVINEGSNRNYSTIADEDGEFKDWIELYNSGDATVSLLNYSLSDSLTQPAQWIFPNISLLPGEFKTIFCSGKDRRPISAFNQVANVTEYTPITNWNTHAFAEPFYWDGVSNILISMCAYNNTQYTSNSVFNQSATDYYSTVFAFQDGSDGICGTAYGTRVKQRPNIKLNSHVIGTGNIQNGGADYPAPYGNWYWASKHQMLITAAELTASGLTAGNINSISFDVAGTDPNTFYTYINIFMKMVAENEVSSMFAPIDVNLNEHTNFGIDSDGETVYLFSPTQNLISQLEVNCVNLDNSKGLFPDAASNTTIFGTPTPSATNNLSETYNSYLLSPVFSVPSGIYGSLIQVNITNPNIIASEVRYSIDGSDPTTSSLLYTGLPISILYSSVLKAKVFSITDLPSETAVSSYLIGISHTTPILSVVTDNANLYGANGIFDNWSLDWQKAAYVEYFDTAENLIFSQPAGMQMDGGAGGSRSNPQHSFRVELDHSVLGGGTIDYPMIPNRPERTKYSKLYLRNGSNQYLTLPYKDAAQVTALGSGTYNYYSAMEPITVYINGEYFGLYELREKIDSEYFEEYENANVDSMDIYTLSYWYGLVLRAVEGSTDAFFAASAEFDALDPAETTFWDSADQYFDLKYYVDYIIAESYVANKDWPGNNMKIYRSDKTNYRYRFCIVDLELSLQPNGWSSASDNSIQYLFEQSHDNPYINVWLNSIQNEKFKNYFINRYADLMNTAYTTDRLLAVENEFYTKMVAEMPKEYARWGDAGNVAGQMDDFNENHQIMVSQWSARTEYMRNYIQSGFALDGQVDVTLNTIPEGAGRIKISTIVPESLPWTGVYFNGNPVTISVIPNNGYEFSHWQANSVLDTDNPEDTINLNIFTDAEFFAVFSESETQGILSISEVNYHSDSTRDAGDWIEFHNYGDGPYDISGWHFTDSTVSNDFVFPEGTIIQPDERFVLSEDTIQFRTQHTGVENLWEFNFGFSNSGESLTLLDNYNAPILTMHYLDSLQWPKAADGNGRTLELINDDLDPALAQNWFAGCIGGSPGAAYSPCSEELIISEINYKSSADADAGDWIELHNQSSSDIDVSNWKFRDDDDLHTFEIVAGTIIPAGGYLVLYSNQTKFYDRFPDVTNITGPFTFGLGGTGDAVRIFDQSGNLYQSVLYSSLAPWPQGAVGNGFTLELLDEQGIFCDGNNWIDGCPEGSPGVMFFTPCGGGSIDLVSALQFNAFPNPTDGEFSISGEGLPSGEYKFVCANIFGQVVFEEMKNVSGNSLQMTFSIADFGDGLYFLSIETKDSKSVVKIVKQNN